MLKCTGTYYVPCDPFSTSGLQGHNALKDHEGWGDGQRSAPHVVCFFWQEAAAAGNSSSLTSRAVRRTLNEPLASPPLPPSRKCFYSKVPRRRRHRRESWLHTSYVDPLSLNSPLFCSFWRAALPASRTWGRGGVPFSNFIYIVQTSSPVDSVTCYCVLHFSLRKGIGEREREAADTHTGGGNAFQAALWPVWGSRSFGYVFV